MLVILDVITRNLSLRRLPPGPGCDAPLLPSRNIDKESSIQAIQVSQAGYGPASTEGLDILKLT